MSFCPVLIITFYKPYLNYFSDTLWRSIVVGFIFAIFALFSTIRKNKSQRKLSLPKFTIRHVTFFHLNLKDMFRCFEHYRQLQNI